MDATIRKWNIKPFSAMPDRCLGVYSGATHGADKNLLKCAFSPDQEYLAAGSANKIVHVWDSNTSKLAYYLPGHIGTVNEVAFHPSEPIIASAGSDKVIYIGELASSGM